VREGLKSEARQDFCFLVRRALGLTRENGL
jgi:hypothetical protein